MPDAADFDEAGTRGVRYHPTVTMATATPPVRRRGDRLRRQVGP